MEIRRSPTHEVEQGPEAESSTSHCCNHQPGEWDECILLASMNRVQMFWFCSKAKNGSFRSFHEMDFFFLSGQAYN